MKQAENAMQRAYNEGFLAFNTDPIDPETGKYTSTSHNPYKPKGMYYREWERGFNAAYFANLRKAV